MTFKANNAAGGSNGTAVTTANSGGASGDAWNTVSLGAAPAGAITFDNSTSPHGSLCYLVAGAAGRNTFLSWSFVEGTQFWGRAYFRLPANPASVFAVINHQLSSTSGVRLQINTTGKLLLMDAGGTVRATGTVSMTLNTWLRLEWSVTFSATTGTISASWYADDSTTASESLSVSSVNTAASMDSVLYGIHSVPANAVTVRLGDVGASNIGPLGPWRPPFPAPTAGQAVARASFW